MDTLHYLAHGFSVALQPIHLLYCFIGVLAGTLVGVLPAIGPTAAIAILLPAAFHLDPVSAIIMLTGIGYGASYGGSTTSILVNVPGDAASVVTCFDGHPMALQGRAGPALGISAFGSFIAGTLGVVALMLFAPALARLTLHFGPPEYFALMVMSLTMVAYMARGSMIRALMMVGAGLILSTVGLDPIAATSRFTYNILALQEGLNIVPVVIGLFGLAEIIQNLLTKPTGELLKTKITSYLPSRQDWKDSLPPIIRGGGLGFVLGLLPGLSPMVATFVSYGIEKKLSRHPERFGHGAIEGVAGPEAANNGVSCGSLVPLYSLGIPTGAVSAMMLAALVIFGMSPGPQFIANSPDLFWGLVASLYVGNLFLLVLNLPLIPLWVRLLRAPFIPLNATILVLCAIGAFSVSNHVEDVYLAVIFGVAGFAARKLDLEAAPMILAMILGPMIEASLRRSLIISDGELHVFVTRPIAATFFAIAVLVVLSAILPTLRRRLRQQGPSDSASLTPVGRRPDRFFVGLSGLAIGAYAGVESVRLGVGDFHHPGSGFFPMVGALLLAVCSLALLATLAGRSKAAGPTARRDHKLLRGAARTSITTIVALAAYAAAFEPLGFIVSTVLVVTALLRWIDARRWLSAFAIACAVAAATYAFFDIMLDVNLPKGILKAVS